VAIVRVLPFGKEDGTEGYDQQFNNNQDAVDVRGVFLQNDTSNDAAVLITRDNASPSNMTFADGVVSGTKTLLQLLSTNATQVEIDFGTSPLYNKVFTITDAAVLSTSKMLAVHDASLASAGKLQDDAEYDGLVCRAFPAGGGGSFTLYVDAYPGPVVGKFKILYVIAV
jgi:hypothetical protein